MPRMVNMLLWATLAAGLLGAGQARADRSAALACMQKALSGPAGRAVSCGELDAFAVMDLHTGRVLWWRHARILAQNAFQPASVFKVITAYAALEAQGVEVTELYDCKGWQGTEGPPGRSVRCWLKPGHGRVNLTKALAYSCNLYFAHLAARIDPPDLLAAARTFGLGRSTGSDFAGEHPGHLPGQATAQDVARLAIGQGDGVLVSPLQLLSLIGAVANGGVLYSPRKKGQAQRGVIGGAASLRLLRQALEEASTFGTGSVEALGRLRMAGKTGTAAWQGTAWRTHGWYMGYWPMRRPELALVAFVHKGNGAKDAAGLARRVLEDLLPAARRCGLPSTGRSGGGDR